MSSIRKRIGAGTAAGAMALVALAAGVASPSIAAAAPLPEAPACAMFPADNVWQADVSALPLDAKSATYVASIGATSSVHADFGSGTWDGGPIGIPYNVVPGTQAPGAGQLRLRRRERRRPVPDPGQRPDRGRPGQHR